jgi:hypothetical protein
MADGLKVPSYIFAADNHNLGDQSLSWFSLEGWAERLGNVGNYTATSFLAGTNSFYNLGMTVGNFLGADVKERSTESFISSLDYDLGQYYRKDPESAEFGGFILGSLVPGYAGLKTLHAGQKALVTAQKSGYLGGNLGKATGLLIPKTEQYMAAAMADLNASTTAFKLLNTNTVRAIGSGLKQNVLEAAAMETFVQAAMFKSPVLENQDGWDIVQNIALGGAIGGVFGGAFGTAKLLGRVKTLTRAEDEARFPFTSRPQFAPKTTSADRISQYAWDIESAAIPVKVVDAEGKIINNYESMKKLYQGKVAKNFLDIRDNINKLASGDTQLGNLVADISTPVIKGGEFEDGFSQRYFQNFTGVKTIVRAAEETKLEIAERLAKAKALIPDTPVAARWVKTLGEGVGEVTTEVPRVLYLADRFKGEKEVKRAVKKYGFSRDFSGSKIWDATKLSGVNAHFAAEARYIWAHKMLDKVPDGAIIHAYDIPVLERAYFDRQLNIKIQTGEGPSLAITTPATKEELYTIIKQSKEDVAATLGKAQQTRTYNSIPADQGTEAIAKITNTKVSYLEGNQATNEFDDVFAHVSAAKTWKDTLAERELSANTTEAAIDPMFLPKYAKMVYALEDNFAAVTPHVADALALFKAQQILFQEGADRVTAKIVGTYAEQLPAILDDHIRSATRVSSSSGLLTSDSSRYGSLGSIVSSIGRVTREIKQQARKTTGDTLASPLVALAGKPAAALEFESLNQKLTRTGKLFHVRETTLGDMVLVEKSIAKQFADEPVDFELLEEGVNYFKIQHQETLDAIQAHIYLTGKRSIGFKEIAAQSGGKEHIYDQFAYRPIRPNLKDYPHFVIVEDPRVTGAGHKTMIHAASEKELAALVDKVPSEYRVWTKQDTEDFFRARHEYEYSRGLNENYIDSALANRGVFSNFFPKSDPQKIIDDVLQQHYRESDTLMAETIRMKYAPQFDALEDMGRQYSKIDTSLFGGRIDALEKTANNPYFNYIKTALDISKVNEHPLIFGANRLLDTAVSKAYASIQNTWFTKVKTTEDLALINAQLDQYGMKPAYYDSALQVFANHSAPKGVLTKFVRSANSLLSLFTLGLDPLNALNNAIGSTILRGTELKHLTRAIAGGNSELAGELAKISKIGLPGTGDSIFAPRKLIAKAVKNFWEDNSVEPGMAGFMGKYKSMGLIKDRAEQLKLLVDDLTLKGTESVKDLDIRLSSAMQRARSLSEWGEKKTMNKVAEEFNRYVSANVMDQITDVAVKAGIMSSQEAQAYITTFVNRVEGNIIASQRPLIFQGPIGQAISLFQSYQFNLLQQLFRYVGEGSGKDLAMLVGLQSTLYGLQSLPAFQFMNVHIIGQMSGNKEHKDAYDTIYGITGRTAGDFILYGLPSNILHTNIYSRGDINPRHLTILPTSLQEIPIVQGWGKLFASLKDTAGKIGDGGNVWESILQGVEHNGISRPLAGLAQVLQATGPEGKVYSTSSKGSILFENDLVSLASLSRLAGGRPLDEALVNDAMFRIRTYEAARTKSMQSLSELAKGSLIQGNTPSDDQIVSFAKKYAELGGKQSGFNRWMMNMYKSANESQAEQITNSLSSPFSYKMQLLMGGEEE